MEPACYLDYNGSTPVDPEVARAFRRWIEGGFGNPSAAHPEGRRAKAAVEDARATIAGALGARPGEVWFTSGGTESNNWAIASSARVHAERTGAPGHVVVSAIEHKSVLRSAEALRRDGVEVSLVAPGADGAVRLEDVRAALRDDTFLVALMLANNETGVLQPAAEVGALCRERGVRFLCDAVCAVGKVPVDVARLGCDLLSLSSHKFYAPKGSGVLYVREGVELPPLVHGCGQQDGMRSGTENAPGVVAFGRAFERMAEGAFDPAPIAAARDRLWESLRAAIPGCVRNGEGPCLPNTLSVAFPGASSDRLQAELGERGYSVAAGAAATNGAPSHVLSAMGLGDERARSTLRFTLGAGTTDRALSGLVEALAELVPSTPTPVR